MHPRRRGGSQCPCYNSGSVTLPDQPLRAAPPPHQRRSFRRHEWLGIYLPLIGGMLILGLLVALAWSQGVGSASVWSDISLTFLLGFALGIGLILLILIVLLAVGLSLGIHWLPLPALRGRLLAKRVEGLTKRVVRLGTKPIVLPQAIWSGFRAGFRSLATIFRSAGKAGS